MKRIPSSAPALLLCLLLTHAACDRSPSPPTPPPTSIESRITHIVAEQFGVKDSEIHPATRLKQDLKADDLDEVELTMEVEDAFKIRISDEDAAKLTTVAHWIEYVRSHAPAAATAPTAPTN